MLKNNRLTNKTKYRPVNMRIENVQMDLNLIGVCMFKTTKIKFQL